MQTEQNVDDRIKFERRKVFYALNALPWVIVVVVLIGISIYYRNQYILTLNASSPAKEILVNAVDVVDPVSNNKTDTITSNSIASITSITSITECTECDLLKIRLSNAYDEAMHEYQVEAVSNNYAEWIVNVRGETSFKWKDFLEEPIKRSINGIPLQIKREHQMTIENVNATSSIGIDVEGEIIERLANTIEITFMDRFSKEDQKLKKELILNLTKTIKKFFDGLETYNNRR